MYKYGANSMIWTEVFSVKDLPLLEKVKAMGFDIFDIAIVHPETFPTKQVKAKVKEVGIEVVTTRGLELHGNLISSDSKVRRVGIDIMKHVVDINYEIGSKIIGGVSYASWGYVSGKPRTDDEWKWSVEAMREIAQYAKQAGDLIIAVEPVNRFETHFLNIAADAVKYCKDVGTGNMKVHLDTFHMMHEESSIVGAVMTCGKEYLGYVHTCENNRGIPGTGLVPWVDFYQALRKIGYTGGLVIESFNPDFEELNKNCAIWRKFADTEEQLAAQGLKNLKAIESSMY